jgi:hypothetical protein
MMDQTRRFIANDTDRAEDRIEKTDTALVGLAAQLLETRKAVQIVLLTTDKPAGRAAETLLPKHGFHGQIRYRYVSREYLETLPPNRVRLIYHFHLSMSHSRIAPRKSSGIGHTATDKHCFPEHVFPA